MSIFPYHWRLRPFQVMITLFDMVLAAVFVLVAITFWSILIFGPLHYHVSWQTVLAVLGLGVTSGILATLGWIKLVDSSD